MVKAVKAIGIGDYAAHRLPAMQRKVSRALALLDEHMSKILAGVSVSTGKDSLVTLHLARMINPDIHTAYYHSGNETEHSWNLEFCQRYQINVIHTEQTLADLCRDYGYWGHTAEKHNAQVNWFAFLVGEPAMRFINTHGLEGIIMGLRAQESMGRRMSRRKRGLAYTVQNVPGYDAFWHITPIADWTHDDVWAYIAGNNLWYNPAYDAMAVAGIPREHWRVSALLGSAAANLGRFAALRQVDPEQFAQLAAQFPRIKEFT